MKYTKEEMIQDYLDRYEMYMYHVGNNDRELSNQYLFKMRETEDDFMKVGTKKEWNQLIKKDETRCYVRNLREKDLMKKSKEDLKEMCKVLELDDSGVKENMIKRLKSVSKRI